MPVKKFCRNFRYRTIHIFKDVLRTVAQLPNIVHGMLHMVEFEQWNHLDFLWAKDVDK